MVARRATHRRSTSREVVGVPAREILLGSGNIHCITQQVPQADSKGSTHNRVRTSSI